MKSFNRVVNVVVAKKVAAYLLTALLCVGSLNLSRAALFAENSRQVDNMQAKVMSGSRLTAMSDDGANKLNDAENTNGIDNTTGSGNENSASLGGEVGSSDVTQEAAADSATQEAAASSANTESTENMTKTSGTTPEDGSLPPTDLLKVSNTEQEKLLDLSYSGQLDWVHFNNSIFEAYERKNGGGLLTGIREYGRHQRNPLYRGTPCIYSWSDGAYNLTGTDATGFIMTQPGSGIEFVLPASLTEKYAVVNLGVWAADVKVVVSYDGNEQYTELLSSQSTVGGDTLYRSVKIAYRTASTDTEVKVNIEIVKVHDRRYGNFNISCITLAAKTLGATNNYLENDKWRLDFENGVLSSMRTTVQGSNYQVPLRHDERAGFNFKLDGRILQPQLDEAASDSSKHTYTAAYRDDNKDVSATLAYEFTADGKLQITASLRNNGSEAAHFNTAALLLGFDSYQESYPSYYEKLFPTLLRVEKTHAWGYFQSPSGHIMCFATADPVASYTIDYSYNPKSKWSGHRIYTASLDLLKSGKLPERHPQGLDTLAAAETKTWTLYVMPVNELNQPQAVKPLLGAKTNIPLLSASRYTLADNEISKLTIYSQTALLNNELQVKGPNGEQFTLALMPSGTAQYQADFAAAGLNPGLYKVYAENAAGYIGEMTLTVRNPWSWYLKQARQAALDAPQKGGTHAEQYYGFYSAYLARRYFPDRAVDARVDKMFDEVYPIMFDNKSGLVRHLIDRQRIQNSSTMLGILIDSYEADGNRDHLRKAEQLADFLLKTQRADGGYYSWLTDYTSVIYPAKSLMEIYKLETALSKAEFIEARERDEHAKRAARYFTSLQKAMDKLVRIDGNFDTEGESTYEDGANSCAVAELSEFALLFPKNSNERNKYLQAAETYITRHTSLQQTQVPDSRMNGATLRFWEALYDAGIKPTSESPNMMNSPHGWSAWNIYGLFNLYELTGKLEYLQKAMNAMGTTVQVMSFDGRLNWAFVPDPQRNVELLVKDEANSKGDIVAAKYVPYTISEEYVPLTSYWWRAKPHTYTGGHMYMYGDKQGASSDQDVHEIFKALAETALTKAYVNVDETGKVEAYNCTVSFDGATLCIEPEEDVVSNISVLTGQDTPVIAKFRNGETKKVIVSAGEHTWITCKEKGFLSDVAKR